MNNKPPILYHISSKIPKDENVLKVHRNVNQNREVEGDYVFASSDLNYISAFRNDYCIFRGGYTLKDDIRIFLIVSDDIDRLREEMKNNPSSVYTVSSEKFTQTIGKNGKPTKEWTSKENVPILSKIGTISYEEILKNAQVFYMKENKDFDINKYDKLIKSLKLKYGTDIKKTLKDLVDSGIAIYENSREKINCQWLEQEKSIEFCK